MLSLKLERSILVTEELSPLSSRSETGFRQQNNMRNRGCGRKVLCAALGTEHAMERTLRVRTNPGTDFVKVVGGGGTFVSQIGGFSHDSEHDLAVMVSDFMENGSLGAESKCSSDSDSGLSDLAHLAEKFNEQSITVHESNLLSVVHSITFSMNEAELPFVKSGPCNECCIRHLLVKHLIFSGYDAALCSSKWQGAGKVPGGEHEYIDVVVDGVAGTDRIIIDVDFQSHFEIARAVESYNAMLKSLPVIYVGSLTRLNHYLQVMADAAKSSLKQNSMPLPPWRTLAYLRAKWNSTYQRKKSIAEWTSSRTLAIEGESNHKQCSAHLKRLKVSLQCEIEKERLLKPLLNDNYATNRSMNRRVKFDRWRQPLFRT